MPAGKPQIAVGAIVVRNDELLMIKRAGDPGRGMWSIPGGRVEHGEYLHDAVAREVREETGLEVTPTALVGILEVVGDPHYVILDFAATPADDSAGPVAAGDAAEVRWVRFDEISGLRCTPRFLETLTSWGVLPTQDQQT